MVKDTPPEKLEQLVKERIEDPDIQTNSRHLLVLQHPWMNPPGFDVLLNSTDGPFYWERSPSTKYDKIRIPAYCGSGWYAYTYTHLAGAFRNFAGVKGPKKLLISGPFFRGRTSSSSS
jgi:predicted acyl esterase